MVAAAAASATLAHEDLLEIYRRMRLARRFEETVNELYMQGRIPSTLHLYIGQEAVAVGVLRSCSRATRSSARTGRTATRWPRRVAPCDHGRAVGQGDRLLQGQGRLDARRRHDASA